MTYVPVVGDRVVRRGRPNSEVEVIAVDPITEMMGIRAQGSSRPIWVSSDDQWEKVVPRPQLPDVWHVATSAGVSRGFASRAVVMNNLPAEAVALFHVNPAGTVDVEWLPPPPPPPPPVPDPVPPPDPAPTP